jgi:membrane protease YdiL (CAAX protease family)
VLVGANVLNNRVLPDRGAPYVVSCLVSAGLLVGLARSDGAGWEELGLGPGSLRRGAGFGAAASGAVLVAAAASLTGRWGRAALRDERALRLGRRGALGAALLRVPLGTVALEETAFRSVLPALLVPRLGPARATATTAVLFGLWHVLPSATLAADNAAVGRLTGGSPRRAVALSVGATTLAGLGFDWLRRRSGSLAAPALVHWTTNASGYLAAASRGAALHTH